MARTLGSTNRTPSSSAIWEALEVDLESQQGQPTVDIGVLGSRETCQKVGIGAREVVLSNDPVIKGGSQRPRHYGIPPHLLRGAPTAVVEIDEALAEPARRRNIVDDDPVLPRAQMVQQCRASLRLTRAKSTTASRRK